MLKSLVEQRTRVSYNSFYICSTSVVAAIRKDPEVLCFIGPMSGCYFRKRCSQLVLLIRCARYVRVGVMQPKVHVFT